MEWKEKYYNLWSKYLSLSLRDSWLLEEEINDIDEQIRRLQIRRAKLVARKHQESKDRIIEETKQKKMYPVLHLPFNKK